MRVLGIDPGARVTGFGVVEEGGRSNLRQLAAGVVRPRTNDSAARLGAIASEVERLIDAWKPESIALESPFVGKNVASALRLGEVRGAILALAGRRQLTVVDYPPATVKVAVTGSGVAEKAAVARGVGELLGAEREAGDATDALAVAICHLRHASFARRLRDSRG
jgi:crossover junction endodeoxyribonuclease RuvC